MRIQDGLVFDDVLLVPQYSEVRSRSTVSTETELCKGFKFSSPIVPSNMKTITGFEMAKAMREIHNLAVVHRFMPFDEQLEVVGLVKSQCFDAVDDPLSYVGFSVGVKQEDYQHADQLVAAGVKILTVDIAHGHSKMCEEMVQYIAGKYPELLLIAGNAATAEGAGFLWRAGADIVKSGVGCGSICTTRIATGNGVPALTTLMDIASERHFFETELKRKLFVMNDGGCKSSGDLVKALCFADMVMTGNLFAGCEEVPGDVLELDGHLYKQYVGSSTHRGNHTEGVKSIMPIRPSAKIIMEQLLEGIRSGASYQGVSSVKDLQKNPKFVRQTALGARESNHHDVRVID
jgi:IMP dehydrogenase